MTASVLLDSCSIVNAGIKFRMKDRGWKKEILSCWFASWDRFELGVVSSDLQTYPQLLQHPLPRASIDVLSFMHGRKTSNRSAVLEKRKPFKLRSISKGSPSQLDPS